MQSYGPHLKQFGGLQGDVHSLWQMHPLPVQHEESPWHPDRQSPHGSPDDALEQVLVLQSSARAVASEAEARSEPGEAVRDDWGHVDELERRRLRLGARPGRAVAVQGAIGHPAVLARVADRQTDDRREE